MLIGAVQKGFTRLFNNIKNITHGVINRVMPTRPVALHDAPGFRDKCGVFGIFSPKSFDIGDSFYTGLNTIQNRGQSGCGVAYSSYQGIKDWKSDNKHSRGDLVNDLFYGEVYKTIEGHFGIGHTLYTTSKADDENKTVHPIMVGEGENQIALVHNGNVPDTSSLKNFLVKKAGMTKEQIASMNDSSLMAHIIHHHFKKSNNLTAAVTEASKEFKGAYALLVMSKNQLVALRDPTGIRPLNLGKDSKGKIILSSETHTFDALNAEFIREIQPGELLTINKSTLNTNFKEADPIIVFKPEQIQKKLDAFEHIYFARPQSKLHGRYISEMRREAGKKLANIFKNKHGKVKLDVVIPVPESGIPAATGFAEAMGLPINPALVKNSHRRTFIDGGKEKEIRAKFALIKDAFKDKHVALVDDSIVKGNTSKYLLEYIREAKPASIHFLSASPPILFPDYYGIDLAKQEQLIAYLKKKESPDKFEEKVAEYIDADTVTYLSIPRFVESTGLIKRYRKDRDYNIELSKFTGNYSADIGKRRNEIDFSVAA